MKKNKLLTVILILIFLAGLSLLLYPSVSNYWNSLHQSRAITDYVEQVKKLDDDDYKKLWEDARQYNRTLPANPGRYLSQEERAEYESLLNLSEDGIMGYIEIPLIGCYLPIYHGTDKTVLEVGVGHIEASSLPTGGEGTHCVLSGHRGLPSAKLFTDLDKLSEGDNFILQVLNETLTYEVDQILIVEPDRLEALEIEPDKDYCTLVTCTPYGVNSHRLLVRGHRVENAKEAGDLHATADAMQIQPVVVAILIGVVMLLMLTLVLFVKKRKK